MEKGIASADMIVNLCPKPELVIHNTIVVLSKHFGKKVYRFRAGIILWAFVPVCSGNKLKKKGALMLYLTFAKWNQDGLMAYMAM